jgi:hypothetical protein
MEYFSRFVVDTRVEAFKLPVSVTIVAGIRNGRAKGQGSSPLWENIFFPFSKMFRPALRLTQESCSQWMQGARSRPPI